MFRLLEMPIPGDMHKILASPSPGQRQSISEHCRARQGKSVHHGGTEDMKNQGASILVSRRKLRVVSSKTQLRFGSPTSCPRAAIGLWGKFDAQQFKPNAEASGAPGLLTKPEPSTELLLEGLSLPRRTLISSRSPAGARRGRERCPGYPCKLVLRLPSLCSVWLMLPASATCRLRSC
jgi:hypothetical protein